MTYDSEMGSLMRAFDWAQTGVGPVASWSPSLAMMVSLLLSNRFPMLLWWGPDYVSIYNDAYIPVLGSKHPWALGKPFREVWPEVQHVLGPLIDVPFNGGPSSWTEDILLEINRHGFVEETHFGFAYSPVPDSTAPRGIGGVLATVHEVTTKVIGERRLSLLRDLGSQATQAKSPEEACANMAQALSHHALDVPFASIYLLDANGGQARLAGVAGASDEDPVACSPVSLQDKDRGWPFAKAMHNNAVVLVERLQDRFASVPSGPWSDPPHSAVMIPIRSASQSIVGLFIAGISPRLKLDESYWSFLDLAAAQIATAVANASAYEAERKRAEALAEIDRAKTAFFSNVSHEFRTPLTLMMGPLEQVLDDPSQTLSGEQRTLIEAARRNSTRLLRLVNTLLDFSRIEAGRIQAAFTPTDVGAFTAELASNFRSLMERAGLEYTVDCPPLAEPGYVDREMWEKIVLNLLSNAFKFTFEGTIEVRVRSRGCSSASIASRELTVEPSREAVSDSHS